MVAPEVVVTVGGVEGVWQWVQVSILLRLIDTRIKGKKIKLTNLRKSFLPSNSDSFRVSRARWQPAFVLYSTTPQPLLFPWSLVKISTLTTSPAYLIWSLR